LPVVLGQGYVPKQQETNMLHVLVDFEDPDSCIFFDAVPVKDKEIYNYIYIMIEG